MNILPDEITRALKILFTHDDVFEIRCLNAITRGSNGYPHTECGYFTYDNIDKVPFEMEHIKSCSGVYVVLNPVIPELINRRANKIGQCKKGFATTTDNEIKQRRWLFIDLDPKRASGIASTDEQHEKALNLSLDFLVGMKQCGFEEPVIFDSGNGAHILYNIDMSANDNGLVKRFLTEINGDWSGDIEIDTSVYNPARLIRLPGTMNCKGDSTEERPHRFAKIYHVPDGICINSVETIFNFVAKTEKQQNVYHNTDFNGVNNFDIDDWINKYCPDVSSPVSYNGGRKWLFEQCPFNPEHKRGDAAIIQLSNGAIDFKCFHNHCQQYDWHSLRDQREPGWREKRVTPIADGVDISRIVNGKSQITDTDIIIEDETNIEMPEELFNVGGFIGDVMQLTLDYAPAPNKPLALAGAITLMSFLTARKVKTDSGLRPNVYILGLAESGAGKEKPRDVNQAILESIGCDTQLLETIASGEGLEDLLVQTPALFWQCDEFYSVLKSMSDETKDNTLMRYLLMLYTSSQKNFTTRIKAGKQGVIVPKPHLTLFATTTPEEFFKNVNDTFLNGGMFARMNIVVADKPVRPTLKSELQIPDKLIDTAKSWKNFIPAGSGNLDVEAMAVPYTAGARELAESVYDFQFSMCDSLRSSGNAAWQISLWNRYFEISMRYALLYACSEASSPDKAVMTDSAVKWGSAFARWDIKNKIQITDKKYYRSDFERESEQVIDVLVKWHKKNGNTPMPLHKFSIKTKYLNLKDKALILDSLVSQNRIVRTVTQTTGRPATGYYLPQFAPEQQ